MDRISLFQRYPIFLLFFKDIGKGLSSDRSSEYFQDVQSLSEGCGHDVRVSCFIPPNIYTRPCLERPFVHHPGGGPSPGTACVVPKQYEGCNAIDIIIARPNTEKVNPYYLCTYTNMPHGKRQIEEGTGGAAQQHFNVGKYNKLRVMLPPIDRQKEFVDFVSQIDKSKVAVQKALDEAQVLFDSLMQQYFD